MNIIKKFFEIFKPKQNFTKLNLFNTFPSFIPLSKPGNFKEFEKVVISNINNIVPNLSYIAQSHYSLEIINVNNNLYFSSYR